MSSPKSARNPRAIRRRIHHQRCWGLLLREVEKRTNIIGQFASCFSDYRDPELVETRDGRVVGATDLRIGIRLRGFKRSRGVAARSVVGGAGREGGSDRETAARRRIGRWWIFFCKR